MQLETETPFALARYEDVGNCEKFITLYTAFRYLTYLEKKSFFKQTTQEIGSRREKA